MTDDDTSEVEDMETKSNSGDSDDDDRKNDNEILDLFDDDIGVPESGVDKEIVDSNPAPSSQFSFQVNALPQHPQTTYTCPGNFREHKDQ